MAGELRAALERLSARFEIIIVDDGSDDGTGRIAADLAAQDPRLKLVRHDRNLGYGAALRSGFQAAQYEWIFFMDADGQFAPAELERLLPLADPGGFAAGYRSPRQDPFQRRWLGWLFSVLVRLLFGVKARDVNCAFKLVRKSIIADARLTMNGALINAELLAAARRQGVDPVEAPVTHRPRGQGRSTGGSPRVILRALVEIVQLWKDRGRIRTQASR